MEPLDQVKLRVLMEFTSGRPEVTIGLIDGPVAMNHSGLAGENIRQISVSLPGTCDQISSFACMHGTFVAGILSGNRTSISPAICPNCTLLVRPIFTEAKTWEDEMPIASPEELASAIIDCIKSGARVLNVSAALTQPLTKNNRLLEEALDYAAMHNVVVVAAAGNQGIIGSSIITHHRSVIPVVACDSGGRPFNQSNIGYSIGLQGLSAPGDTTLSLGPEESKPLTFRGTSVAAPFVTGTIALLFSIFPAATVTEVKFAVTQVWGSRRTTVVPPVLDAWAAYQTMLKTCAI